MNQFYTRVKTALIAVSFLSTSSLWAQSPGTTTPGSCPNAVANFNTNDNGYNAPSIHGGEFDSAFYYNSSRGFWTEAAGGQNPEKSTAQGSPRSTSIISPLYSNPNPQGTFNVGFYYVVGNAATDRFQVRIISASGQGGQTVYNFEASSRIRAFSEFSTPTTYTDAVNPTNPLFNGQQGFVCIRLNDVDITNAPGTNYRVEVIFLLNTPNFAVFDNLSIGDAAPIPLPVSFLGVVANRSGNSVNLRWDVADELNVREYQVERSTNGSTFNVVGTIPASSKTNVYSFTDTYAEPGNVYYRVKNLDADGRFKYSSIIKLKGASSFGSVLKAYPLPALNQVTLEHKKLSNKAKITVNSLEGKTLKVVNPVNGASHTLVNLSGLSSGMYVIKLENGEGETEMIKIIKQ